MVAPEPKDIFHLILIFQVRNIDYGSLMVTHGKVCNFGEVCNIRSTFPIKKFDFY